jgi:hypothetical protein
MICELMLKGFTSFEAECMVKIFVEDKSVTATAQELHRSPGNVSDAIKRAKKKCANPEALRIPIGRRHAEFKRTNPKPASQFGRFGLDLNTI